MRSLRGIIWDRSLPGDRCLFQFILTENKTPLWTDIWRLGYSVTDTENADLWIGNGWLQLHCWWHSMLLNKFDMNCLELFHLAGWYQTQLQHRLPESRITDHVSTSELVKGNTCFAPKPNRQANGRYGPSQRPVDTWTYDFFVWFHINSNFSVRQKGNGFEEEVLVRERWKESMKWSRWTHR